MLSLISALTPEARESSESQRRRLLERKVARPSRYDKDPTMSIKDEGYRPHMKLVIMD